MSEQLLQQILSKLDSLDSRLNNLETIIGTIQSQMMENTELVTIICDRLEKKDAKLKSIALNLHHTHGEVITVKETVAVMKVRMNSLSKKQPNENVKQILNAF